MSLDRRHILKVLAGVGIGTAVFQRCLAVAVEAAPMITAAMIEQAEWITGLELTRGATQGSRRRSGTALPPDPAICAKSNWPTRWRRPSSSSRPPGCPPTARPADRSSRPCRQAPPRPEAATDLAFLPVTTLSALIRARQVSSVELTKLYLDRLGRFDPLLHCVVTRTDKLALEQAERADRELAAGRWRGPLHGIPWGAKDLIAYPGYPTTWGADTYKDQVIDTKATVARRLEEAGAVLVAKLTLGALAMGDQLVRRHDAQSVEPGAGFERLVGGLGQRDRGRAGRLCPRQ